MRYVAAYGDMVVAPVDIAMTIKRKKKDILCSPISVTPHHRVNRFRCAVCTYSGSVGCFVPVVLQVAKESALQFCPTANITAYHDSIMK